MIFQLYSGFVSGLRSFLAIVMPSIVLISILLLLLSFRISDTIAVSFYFTAPGIASLLTILISNYRKSLSARWLVTFGILSAGFYCVIAPIVVSVRESLQLGSEIHLRPLVTSYLYFFILGSFLIVPAVVSGVATAIALTLKVRSTLTRPYRS